MSFKAGIAPWASHAHAHSATDAAAHHLHTHQVAKQRFVPDYTKRSLQSRNSTICEDAPEGCSQPARPLLEDM